MFSSVSYLPWVNLCLYYASSVFYKHFLPFNKTENPTFYVGFLGFLHFRDSLSNIGKDILWRNHFYGCVLLVRTPSSAPENFYNLFLNADLLLENKIINQVPQWSFNTLNLAINKNDLFYNLSRLCNILLQYSIKKCKKNFSTFSTSFLDNQILL